jgi:hypothetical protein
VGNTAIDTANFIFEMNDFIPYDRLDTFGNWTIGVGGTTVATGWAICLGSLVTGVTTAGATVVIWCTAWGGTAVAGGSLVGAGFLMKVVAKWGGSLQGMRIGENWSEWSRYIPKDIKETVRVRDGNICVYCKKPTNTEKITNPEKSEIDHKDAFVKTKDNSIDNLQNTCRTCNRTKGTKSDSLFRSLFDF